MALSVDENTVKKLWDTWNIRVLIIISLSVQCFLILFAPLRKQRGGNWVFMISTWVAYLLADWVATFTIGLIFHAKRNDILAFWAPFLLLHLGGPDTITSFSLEDNEFWIRHFFGLMLQIGSTIYVIVQSFPDNKLLLPTFLVLVVGIIKYAERNRAFYLASFDNFGENWVAQPGYSDRRPLVPVQFRNDSFVNWESIFKKAILTFGSIKSYLVGPLMPSYQQREVTSIVHEGGSINALKIIEIHQSLLYELLHTKLPVIDSRIGYVCGILNFVCILGAFLSFLLVKKHYNMEVFEIWLTFGLLIGALALDIISVLALDFFDWFVVAFFTNLQREFINRPRWSNSVSQLSFITYHVRTQRQPTHQKNVKKHSDWFNKLVDFLFMKKLFKFIRKIRCVSSKEFREEEEWQLIFAELDRKISNADNAREMDNEVRPSRFGGILQGNSDLGWSIEEFEYVQSLLMWHIATELCYLDVDTNNSRRPTTSDGNFYHRTICKSLSNYMFYLVVMEPTMMAAVSDNWKMVLKETSEEAADPKLSSISNELDFSRELLSLSEIGLNKRENGVLFEASFLANKLKQHPGGCPWELMSRVWVELVCHAATNSSPIVHARQLSKGGELLTLVWLLANHLGLTSKKKEW